MADYRNDAPRKRQAEGDRWKADVWTSPREAGDIVNRGAFDTPRRYDQPIEDDDDPVMPSDDATLNTKI